MSGIMSNWDICFQKNWSKKTVQIKVVGSFFIFFEDRHYLYKSWAEKILIKYISIFVD